MHRIDILKVIKIKTASSLTEITKCARIGFAAFPRARWYKYKMHTNKQTKTNRAYMIKMRKSHSWNPNKFLRQLI